MAVLRAHASVAETGESPFAVRITAGDHVFTGDEGLSAGGGGLGPSPFELLSAALAECTAMTMRWYAREQGWSVDGIEVAVEYSRRQFAGASTAVDVFEKTISIRSAALSAEQRTRLLDVAGKCPVQRTLEKVSLITTLVQPAPGGEAMADASGNIPAGGGSDRANEGQGAEPRP